MIRIWKSDCHKEVCHKNILRFLSQVVVGTMANVLEETNILNICKTKQSFILPWEQELYIAAISDTKDWLILEETSCRVSTTNITTGGRK